MSRRGAWHQACCQAQRLAEPWSMSSEALQRPVFAHSSGSTAACLMLLLGQKVGPGLLCANSQRVCSTCLSASTCMAHILGTCIIEVLHGMPTEVKQHAGPTMLQASPEHTNVCTGTHGSSAAHAWQALRSHIADPVSGSYGGMLRVAAVDAVLTADRRMALPAWLLEPFQV